MENSRSEHSEDELQSQVVEIPESSLGFSAQAISENYQKLFESYQTNMMEMLAKAETQMQQAIKAIEQQSTNLMDMSPATGSDTRLDATTNDLLQNTSNVTRP